MALATADIVRGRLNDPLRYDTELHYGDGSASSFKLRQGAPYSTLNWVSASVYATSGGAGGFTGWSATGGTFDLSRGTITFSATPSANSAVHVAYDWSVFGTADIEYFTGLGGITDAVLEGINWLLVDASKRARWAAPDGSEYDDRQVLEGLLKTRSALRVEQTDEQGPQGGIESWSYQQRNY